MSRKTVPFELISQSGVLLSSSVAFVAAPGVAGELGIYPGHMPLIALLRAGLLRVHTPEKEIIEHYITGGLLLVQPMEVKLLVDTTVSIDHLDSVVESTPGSFVSSELLDRAGRYYLDEAAARSNLVRAIEELKKLRKRQQRY